MEINTGFIAVNTEEDTYGMGNTLEEAFDALKIESRANVDFESVVFYKATKIKVIQKLEIQDEIKSLV